MWHSSLRRAVRVFFIKLHITIIGVLSNHTCSSRVCKQQKTAQKLADEKRLDDKFCWKELIRRECKLLLTFTCIPALSHELPVTHVRSASLAPLWGIPPQTLHHHWQRSSDMHGGASAVCVQDLTRGDKMLSSCTDTYTKISQIHSNCPVHYCYFT